MTALASYTDPAAGTIFLRLPVTDVELASIVHDSERDPQYAKRSLARYAWRRVPGILSHEWAHLFQVAEYPLLHLRAARQMLLVSQRLKEVRESEGPIDLPVSWKVDEVWSWSSLLQTVPVRVHVGSNGVTTTPGRPGLVRRGMLREIDLVEEDATVFQYRVETEARGSGPGYRRWLLQGSRYSSVFFYLADLVGDDHAINLIPVITRVAFRTTRPLEAFGAILADLIHHGVSTFTQPFPDAEWDRWAEGFFLDRMRQRMGDAADESLSIGRAELDNAPGVISDEQHQDLVRNTPHLVASLFSERSRADGRFLMNVLRTPSAYFKRRASSWDPKLDVYAAPLILYVLTSSPSGFVRTLVTASDVAQATRVNFFGPEVPDLSVATMVWESMRVKQLTDVGVGLREPLARCPHSTCGYHGKGLCEGWVPIPVREQDCDFPAWLRAATKFTLGPDGTTLVRRNEKGLA